MKYLLQENKEEPRKEWVLDCWYEKVFYVVGIVMTAFMVLSFIGGFLEGIMEM